MPGANGDGGTGFGGHLADFGRAVLADARLALEEPGITEAARVHELRKAFKRWRAWLRLLEEPIGEPAEALRVKARALMRGLSGARDAQGALDAIDDIAKSETSLSPRTLATIRSRLIVQRDAAESASLTPELRADIASYLTHAGETLATWPLAGIAFGAIADGLTATYRRARHLTPEEWQLADSAPLHELRRRVVELRHQMELIEPLWPRVTRAWAEEAQRLRNQLGACQDLTVLGTFVAPHQPLAPWRSRLMPLIQARRERHLKNAARLASRLFAEKPKGFCQRIAALWAARENREAAKAKK